MNDQAIEQEIQAKGLTAPRITPADIEANIVAEYFFTAEQAVSGFNAAMVDRFLGWKLPRVGTKLINATPMTRQEYNDFRHWVMPAEENGADEGYLVEYVDGGKPNHPDFAGYISWSPKDVFERSYRPVQNMTFGMAIEALKAGKKVARIGWNGKGMWLSLSGHGGGSLVHWSDFWSTNNANFAAAQEEQSAIVLPCITMKTADDKILMGWLASQTDMLAEDWCVVE